MNWQVLIILGRFCLESYPEIEYFSFFNWSKKFRVNVYACFFYPSKYIGLYGIWTLIEKEKVQPLYLSYKKFNHTLIYTSLIIIIIIHKKKKFLFLDPHWLKNTANSLSGWPTDHVLNHYFLSLTTW